MKEEFYTQGRWKNWINKIKESEFTFQEEEDPAAAIFVNAMDDVVLACLKVVARCDRDIISKEEALSTIDDIMDIVFEEHESLGEDADLMLESLKTALTAVFASCHKYVEGEFNKDATLEELVKKAIDAENDGNIDGALSSLSQLGARVLKGESLPEEAIADLPYSLVAELLDGIDAISAAQMGDDSYKEEDGSEDDSGKL